MVILGLVVSWLLSCAAIAFVAWDRRDWLARSIRRRVIVHTTDDRSVEGVLVAHDRAGVALASAAYLDAGPAPLALAGDLWLPRDRVRFVQVLTPA